MKVDILHPVCWAPNTAARPVIFPATLDDGSACHVVVIGLYPIDPDRVDGVASSFEEVSRQLGDPPACGTHPLDAFAPNRAPGRAPASVPDGARCGTDAVDKCRALALTDVAKANLLRLRRIWQVIASDNGAPVGALAVICERLLQQDGVPQESIRRALAALLAAATLAYLF